MKIPTHMILTLLIPALLVGCRGNEEGVPTGHAESPGVVRLSAAAIKEIGLRSEPATRTTRAGTLSLAAHVVADQDKEARVGTLVPGRVQRVLVKAGDRVARGDILMTIEGLDVGEIVAGYLKAQAAHDFARASYERQKMLFAENVSSQRSLLEAQAEYEKTLAELRAEDRRLHSVGLTHDLVVSEKGEEHAAGTLPVHAPIDGIVVERNVVIGQYVDASVTAFVIMDTHTVWIDAGAYEKDLALITRGAEAMFVADGRPDQRFGGVVSFVGAMVDPRTRTVTVRGDFRNPGLILKPQMYGTMDIVLPRGAEGIFVPEESLVKEEGSTAVFVQRSDTTFERRTVTTGLVTEGVVEVTGGVRIGERVVVSGAFYVKSEMKKTEFEGDAH